MTSSITNCQWCATSLSNMIAYELKTTDINTQTPVTYIIGADCCMRSGRHAAHVNTFRKKHKYAPFMFFTFRADPATVSYMIKHKHLEDAVELNAKMSPADRELVVM
jgi:hypothetical protein